MKKISEGILGGGYNNIYNAGPRPEPPQGSGAQEPPETENFTYSYISPVRMECQLIHEDARLPYRKRNTDAAYDVASIEDAVVPPHDIKNIDTGIIIVAPPGFYITVEARSSLAKQGIIPTRGIIDSCYLGHLMVILTNQTDKEYHVKKFDRIAQIILNKQEHMDFQIVDKFSKEYSHRGHDGWGSTGR